MSALEETIRSLVISIVDERLEMTLPEIIRALMVHAVPEAADEFVDAIEIAKMLGRDVSTPKAIRAARKHVYNLANLNRIPCVRPTPRRMVFDPIAVRKAFLGL